MFGKTSEEKLFFLLPTNKNFFSTHHVKNLYFHYECSIASRRKNSFWINLYRTEIEGRPGKLHTTLTLSVLNTLGESVRKKGEISCCKKITNKKFWEKKSGSTRWEKSSLNSDEKWVFGEVLSLFFVGVEEISRISRTRYDDDVRTFQNF